MAPRGLKKRGTVPKPEPEPPINETPAAEVPLPPETPASGPSDSSPPSQEATSKELKSARSVRALKTQVTCRNADILIQSWYNRTWPRKAAPVTKIAEESISTATDAVSSLAVAAKAKITPKNNSRAPSLQLTKSKAGSNRSLPADATTTIVNATSDPTIPSKPDTQEDTKKAPQPKDPEVGKTANGNTAPSRMPVGDEDKLKEVASGDEQMTSPTRTIEQTPSSWLGWFTRPAPGDTTESPTKVDSAYETNGSTAQIGNGNKLAKPPSRAENPIASEQPIEQPAELAVASQVEQMSTPQKRSWLQMWSPGATESPPVKDQKSEPVIAPDTEASAKGTSSSVPPEDSVGTAGKSETPQPNSKASSIVASPPPDLPGDGTKSGWIFWSRDRKGSTNTLGAPHVGELAISDTPSQKKPKRASISLDEGKDTAKEKDKVKISLLGSKPKKQTASESDARPETPTSQPDKAADTPTKSKGAELLEATKQLQKSVPNALSPSFHDTFSLQENPTFWQQLTRLIGYSKTPQARHVSLVRDPPRIKNAIAIGVHGYFPAPLIRSVLGQPTGTSIKFADMATKAIRKWTNAHGYDCQVKSAALEGEGKIAERVDILWKLLLNWIEEVRKADFILVACHSQGVPVAMMLIARLIAFGCVNSAKVGVCAMAGVNLGPFSDYKSRWISGSAAELFEFSNPESTVSKEYINALETALKYGVKVTYIGSIDDQLVSMEVRLKPRQWSPTITGY